MFIVIIDLNLFFHLNDSYFHIFTFHLKLRYKKIFIYHMVFCRFYLASFY